MTRYHTIPLTMTDEEIDIYLADMQEEEFHFLELKYEMERAETAEQHADICKREDQIATRMRKENEESFRKLDRSTAQMVDDLFKAFNSGTKQ